MVNPQSFRELVSGRKHGLAAAFLRLGLRLAEIPYTAVVSLRNLLYDSKLLETVTVDAFVVSVGNLTLGGTGKTPLVAWLAERLQAQGRSVALISRGYGGRRLSESELFAAGLNDEARELWLRLPGVPHWQNADRVAAARELLADDEIIDTLILDDAFQHRRIARQLDIVLLDALEPFGFEHVFPRGTLREPLSGLRRADLVLLSRCDLIDRQQRDRIRARVHSLAPQAIWGEIAHKARSLVSFGGSFQEEAVELLRGKRILAFCGLGNPTGFLHTIQESGGAMIALEIFPDHHHFTASELEALARRAAREQADFILCTMKDLVKIGLDRLGDLPLFALKIDIAFEQGEAAMMACLQNAVKIHQADQKTNPEPDDLYAEAD